MSKIAPSERIEQAIEQLLNGGLETEEQPVSQLIRLAAQKMVQEAVEKEVGEVLERDRYERRREGQQGLRNGYEPGRIRSAEGEIVVQVPQVRGLGVPYRSKLMDFLRGNSDVIAAHETNRCPSWSTALGGGIGLHGHGSAGDWSAGCIALDDTDIEELFDVLRVGDQVEILP